MPEPTYGDLLDEVRHAREGLERLLEKLELGEPPKRPELRLVGDEAADDSEEG